MHLKKTLRDSIVLGLAAAAAAWTFRRWEGALRSVLLLAIAVSCIGYLLPSLGVSLLDRLIQAARSFHWHHEQGRHHAFAGVPLHIEDDGRHLWVDGNGLQRVLGSSDRDDVLAARHAGRWRRNRDGELLLRVDSVVELLAQGPGRMEPRKVRLRRYFERELLFPAAERRRRDDG